MKYSRLFLYLFLGLFLINFVVGLHYSINGWEIREAGENVTISKRYAFPTLSLMYYGVTTRKFGSSSFAQDFLSRYSDYKVPTYKSKTLIYTKENNRRQDIPIGPNLNVNFTYINSTVAITGEKGTRIIDFDSNYYIRQVIGAYGIITNTYLAFFFMISTKNDTYNLPFISFQDKDGKKLAEMKFSPNNILIRDRNGWNFCPYNLSIQADDFKDRIVANFKFVFNLNTQKFFFDVESKDYNNSLFVGAGTGFDMITTDSTPNGFLFHILTNTSNNIDTTFFGMWYTITNSNTYWINIMSEHPNREFFDYNAYIRGVIKNIWIDLSYNNTKYPYLINYSITSLKIRFWCDSETDCIPVVILENNKYIYQGDRRFEYKNFSSKYITINVKTFTLNSLDWKFRLTIDVGYRIYYYYNLLFEDYLGFIIGGVGALSIVIVPGLIVTFSPVLKDRIKKKSDIFYLLALVLTLVMGTFGVISFNNAIFGLIALVIILIRRFL